MNKIFKCSENPKSEKIIEHSKQIAAEFCERTPIHGVKHFTDKDVLLVERFDHQAASIYTIPFPAITICPETKVKSSELNVSHTFQLAQRGQLNETIDRERVRKLLAILQLCEHDLYDRSKASTSDDDILLLLRKMAIPPFEVFSSCYWKGQRMECLDLFKTSLTDKGYCYTFNTLANDDILRTEQLDSRYAFNSETRASNWSLDSGYSEGVGPNVFPHRTITGGYHGGLTVTLLVNRSDVDYFCGNTFQGFKIFLHMPNEFPQAHRFFRVPMNHELIVTTSPQVMTIERRAKQYQPEIRQCYYTNERHLRFYRIYTKQNCEIECLANHTLNLCGCVRFSMPRPSGVPICSLRDNPCYRRAFLSVLKLESKAVEEEDNKNLPTGYCNCLPTCNNIEYHPQVSQAYWDWQKNYLQEMSQSEDVHQSRIVFHFKQDNFIPLKRSEINGLSDMIASCGGLLGLFMGVSILSLVEMLYYCTLRPYVVWRKSKQPAVTEVECHCQCTHEVRKQRLF
ncbi:pickpocket protein 28-like [Malaya genurostris]|uniref:pickpocket protein 28-like n=1 Tax=Malaya genurostris TaxID=325434 RepID=UPI0026F38335|nr:pickpocket protein 28-like [Malaya genurostris]